MKVFLFMLLIISVVPLSACSFMSDASMPLEISVMGWGMPLRIKLHARKERRHLMTSRAMLVAPIIIRLLVLPEKNQRKNRNKRRA